MQDSPSELCNLWLNIASALAISAMAKSPGFLARGGKMHMHVPQQRRSRPTGLGWLLMSILPCAGIWYGLVIAITGFVDTSP
jgi:hypothetical protein